MATHLPIVNDVPQIYVDHFPFPRMRAVQKTLFALMNDFNKVLRRGNVGYAFEVPTGEGKTVFGMTLLSAHASRGPCFYVTPTKALVDQLTQQFPRAKKLLGRSEYPCLYYRDRGTEVDAMQSPCYMLACGHRVDQEDGSVEEPGCEPCPYFRAKFQARTALEENVAADGVVAMTTAGFLMNRWFDPRWRALEPELVVIDEVQDLAETARSIFEHTMTDWQLKRTCDVLKRVDREAAKWLILFLRAFRHLARKYQSDKPQLFKSEHVQTLIDRLARVSVKDLLEAKIRAAVRSGVVDAMNERGELKLLENLIRGIPRMLSSLGYALEGENHRALNYVVVWHVREDLPEAEDGRKRSRFRLTIFPYYVPPIITRVVGRRVVAYSATVGPEDFLKFETGLHLEHHAFASSFDIKRTRIYLPMDALDLSQKAVRERRDNPKKARKQIVAAAKRFADEGLRSLIVVVSNAERDAFVKAAGDAGMAVVSYGGDIKPKDAVERFKAGEGQVLIGTSANFGQGIDLPRGQAPVIFFLRPGYANPDDPKAQFERRRNSEGQYWAIQQWRAMIEARQVRGRNIRGPSDLGVCIFYDQRFRRFLRNALPDWLHPAYDNAKSMEQIVADAVERLKK